MGRWEQVGLGSRQPSAPTLGPSRSEAVESLPRGAPRLTMAPVSARREGRGATVLRDTFPPGLAAGGARPGTLGARLFWAPEGGVCPHLCVCVCCWRVSVCTEGHVRLSAHARLACWGAVSEQACGSLRLPACFLGVSATGCVSASRCVSGPVYLVCAPGGRERLPFSASVSVSIWANGTAELWLSGEARVPLVAHLCGKGFQAKGVQVKSPRQARARGWREAAGGQGGHSRGSGWRAPQQGVELGLCSECGGAIGVFLLGIDTVFYGGAPGREQTAGPA